MIPNPSSHKQNYRKAEKPLMMASKRKVNYGTLYAHIGSRNWAYPRKWIRGSKTNLVSLHFGQELEEKEEKESKAKALAKEEAFHHKKNPNPKKTRTTKGVQVCKFST